MIKYFFFKARRFILKRLLRIVPTYWIVSLAVLFLLTIAPQYFNKTNTNLAHALGSFLFLPISSPSGSFSPLLGVGWSLNMEVYFYIILAVFIRIFKNEYLIPVFCFFSFSTAIGFFIGHREVNYAYSLITSSLMLEFVLGLFAFKIYMSSILSKLNSYVFLLFGIFLLSLPFFIEYKHEFRFIYFGMGYFFIILSSSFFLEKMKFLHNIIMIGDASYAIYLTHYFVLSALLLIIPVENFISFLFFMFVSYLICVIVGVIFYLKIEKFIGNKISLFLGGRNV